MTKLVILTIAVFTALIAYTMYLLRAQKLSPHITVRWIMVEVLALLLVVFWQYLPFFTWTSAMPDRKLLLLVTLGAGIVLIWLLLYSFVYISTHTRQIKILTQELALLRQKLQAAGIDDGSTVPRRLPSMEREEAAPFLTKKNVLHTAGATFALAWAFACLLLYYYRHTFPDAVKAFLRANYLE